VWCFDEIKKLSKLGQKCCVEKPADKKKSEKDHSG
jgi:hypothetical protein